MHDSGSCGPSSILGTPIIIKQVREWGLCDSGFESLPAGLARVDSSIKLTASTVGLGQAGQCPDWVAIDFRTHIIYKNKGF